MTTAFVLLCGVIAVALGEIHLFAAGAPRRYLLVNAAALHPLIGAAVIAGLVVMLLPAVFGALRNTADRPDASRDAAARDTALVFGATWLAIIVASLLGNSPTPLVGAGSSAILGYCLGGLTAGRLARRTQDPPVFS